MADQDLTILNENLPNGDTEEVAVLDEYQRETRKKLKAWAAVEHDPVTGAHLIPHSATPGAATDGKVTYHDAQRELLIASGGLWRSVTQPTFNYLLNGMFQTWYTNPSVATLGWGLGGTTPNFIHQTGGLYGIDNVRMRAIVDFAALSQTVASNVTPTVFGPYTYWRDKTVTFGCFVRTSIANSAYIRINDGISIANSAYAPSTNVWTWLTVTKRIDPAATILIVDLLAVVIGFNAFYCGATLVEGHSCPHPLPSGWHGRQGILHMGGPDIQPNTNTPWWYGVGGRATGSPLTQNFLPFNAVARNFFVNSVSDIGAGTFTAQIEHAGVLTPLLVSFTGANHAGSFLGDGYLGARTGGWSMKTTRNGGAANATFGSLTYEEAP